ncbi:MAG TPA: sensor domain-containing protein [Thermoleophilia bacterium]|nr:sensor domain-containing protein [Thermoleophilia bacterium]
MKQSLLGRFFGVVARPRTWTSVLFNMLAFPLGLFYFVFFVTGLSVGLGLVIIWVGIPILLLVVGAWWLFAAFERLQAEYLLGADVAGSPRPWEDVEGIWGKVKAHFGSASTWKDLLYLLAKLGFGIVSFTVMVTLAAVEAWLVALPIAHAVNAHLITWGNNGNGWTPPLWLGLLGIPCAILWVFVSLHVLNGWSWICARWAELLLRDRLAVRAPAGLVQPAPLVSTSPQPPLAPAPLVSTAPQPPLAPPVPAPLVPPVSPPLAPPAPPGAQVDKPDSSSD